MAQRTVEDRNFEIRKDVLKYDEVMNEQRKVIYRRRQQILDGGDLRDEALEAISTTVERAVLTNCVTEFPEEWDLDELDRQMHVIYPARITRSSSTMSGTATGWSNYSSTTHWTCTRRRNRRSAPTTSAKSNAG